MACTGYQPDTTFQDQETSKLHVLFHDQQKESNFITEIRIITFWEKKKEEEGKLIFEDGNFLFCIWKKLSRRSLWLWHFKRVIIAVDMAFKFWFQYYETLSVKKIHLVQEIVKRMSFNSRRGKIQPRYMYFCFVFFLFLRKNIIVLF